MIVMNGNHPKVFSKHDLILHNLITTFCFEVIRNCEPVRATNKQISLSWCHLMATLVGVTFPIRIVDGFWADQTQHSWLETKSGHIIDVSPIGCRSLPVMYPGRFLEKHNINWKLVFVEGKKNREKLIFKNIRNSDKFKDALKQAIEQTVKVRKKYTKWYYEACKANKIRPLKMGGFFYFSPTLKIYPSRVPKYMFPFQIAGVDSIQPWLFMGSSQTRLGFDGSFKE